MFILESREHPRTMDRAASCCALVEISRLLKRRVRLVGTIPRVSYLPAQWPLIRGRLHTFCFVSTTTTLSRTAAALIELLCSIPTPLKSIHIVHRRGW